MTQTKTQSTVTQLPQTQIPKKEEKPYVISMKPNTSGAQNSKAPQTNPTKNIKKKDKNKEDCRIFWNKYLAIYEKLLI